MEWGVDGRFCDRVYECFRYVIMFAFGEHRCPRVYFYNKGVLKRLKYLSGTVSSSSNARH